MGSLILGFHEGHGAKCGGQTGFGLVGNTTWDVDGNTVNGAELFVEGPTQTYYAMRMIMRDLGANAAGSGTMVQTSTASGNLVASARRYGTSGYAVVVLNDGSGGNVDFQLPAGAGGDLSVRITVPQSGIYDVEQCTPSTPCSPVGNFFTRSLAGNSVTSIRVGAEALPPTVSSVVPAGASTCMPQTVIVNGTGLANGQVVNLGGDTSRTLYNCNGGGTSCSLDPPRAHDSRRRAERGCRATRHQRKRQRHLK